MNNNNQNSFIKKYLSFNSSKLQTTSKISALTLNNHYSFKRPYDVDEFDVFIMKNFVPFSGHENVCLWLDETVTKFNQLKISCDLRFGAVSLLVEGEAKRHYIRNRRQIQSFDDFCKLLLSQFDIIDSFPHEPKFHQIVVDNLSNDEFLYQKTVTDNLKEIVTDNPAITCFNNKTPVPCSTTIDEFSATTISGEILGETSKMVVTKDSTVLLDPLINTLCNPTVDHLEKERDIETFDSKVEEDNETKEIKTAKDKGEVIKNPMTCISGTSNTQRYIPEITHHLDVVPNSCRSYFIQFSLRIKAPQLYKNYTIRLPSWRIFVYKKKKKFKRISTNVFGKNSYIDWPGISQ